ncbi:MAG: FliH/SctL family protein [Thermodesulfobacteriota bacterium]|nr:FliH/SctL family protein [Thermodesulfobacteriota bacterium]
MSSQIFNDQGWQPLVPEQQRDKSTDRTRDSMDFKALFAEGADNDDFTPFFTDPAQADRQKLQAEKAYTDGFAKGEKDGFDKAFKKGEAAVARMEQVLSEIEALWRNMISENEQQILDMICRAAEKAALGRINGDDETVKQSILHAFELIPDLADITITISPDDYEYIESVKDEFFSAVGDLKNIAVVSDPAIKPGGCKIESVAGNVDARIETRLDAIKQAITDAITTA